MQGPDTVSLNALRVFSIVAQHLSIKQAANVLSVTPGAVSHQVKTLEQSIGAQLFVRRNNAIELTDLGTQLAQQAAPGLNSLRTALENVLHNTHTLRIRVSMSFAVRWLIPRLHLFKAKNRGASVQVDTFFDDDRRALDAADVTIGYFRHGDAPDDAEILLDDLCRPYLAPALLRQLPDPIDVASIPALQCARGNWDWKLWLRETCRRDGQLNYAERFDMDDAALRAACAGLGMVLSSEFMVADDLSSGRLVPLPKSKAVSLGAYTMRSSGHETGMSRRFTRWLQQAAKSSC